MKKLQLSLNLFSILLLIFLALWFLLIFTTVPQSRVLAIDPCRADVNHDERVDETDVAIVEQWQGKDCRTIEYCPADIDENGKVDREDLEFVQEHVGWTCWWPISPKD